MIWIVGKFIPALLSLVIPISAITLPPFVFSKEEPSAATIVHEEIHGKQTLDTVLVVWPVLAGVGVALGFLWLAALAPILALLTHFALYVVLWLVGVFILLAKGVPLSVVGDVAYRLHPLEREAYDHESGTWPNGQPRRGDPAYLAGRRPFAWLALVRTAWTTNEHGGPL